MSNEIPTKEIGELLDEISGKIPKLITSLMDTLYTSDSGKKMGQSVGGFYKELVDAGIPPEEAVRMARDYMLSLKDITGTFSNK